MKVGLNRPFLNYVRMCAIGFMFNFGVYFFWLVIPIILKDYDVNSIFIGLAPTFTFGTAGFLSILTGYLSDIIDAECLVSLASVLNGVACFMLGLVCAAHTNYYLFVLSLFIQGISFGLFYSPIETLISLHSEEGKEGRNLAIFFTVCYLGTSFGFLCGGSVILLCGNTFTLYIVGFISLFIFFVVPRKFNDIKKGSTKVKESFEDDVKETKSVSLSTESSSEASSLVNSPQNTESKTEEKEPVKKVSHYREKVERWTFFLVSCFVSVVIYGSLAIITDQYVGYAEDEGIVLEGVSKQSSVFVGVFLFILSIFETISFVIMGITDVWVNKAFLNLLAHLTIIILGLFLYYVKVGWVLVIFVSPVLGLVCGYEYQANVVYALNLKSRPGFFLGVNEFVANVTYCVCPFIAGVMMDFIDRDWCILLIIVLNVFGLIIATALHFFGAVLVYKKRITDESGN
ncbi:hypothetical protein EIN_409190 [Entamoeba invadens IP1]|uniref:Major facilitator superfamily (MFS) profile domain-containing protein n=1 Tax=Entamoeba invadens IP1 TaxID=370355 RepID=A0A0A1TZM1_ENTIV|nr:hypothetical protein EIN_409190 [Entamoeba invadens IP1]ELP85630.1 hypothetical protein EIN_409190 [Entamoeba invadens IP1]|eukprot:XP_004184976.1 hypothetical protein EIN_409190 [Entamoeba invadens IP1]